MPRISKWIKLKNKNIEDKRYCLHNGEILSTKDIKEGLPWYDIGPGGGWRGSPSRVMIQNEPFRCRLLLHSRAAHCFKLCCTLVDIWCNSDSLPWKSSSAISFLSRKQSFKVDTGQRLTEQKCCLAGFLLVTFWKGDVLWADLWADDDAPWVQLATLAPPQLPLSPTSPDWSTAASKTRAQL